MWQVQLAGFGLLSILSRVVEKQAAMRGCNTQALPGKKTADVAIGAGRIEIVAKAPVAQSPLPMFRKPIASMSVCAAVCAVPTANMAAANAPFNARAILMLWL